MSVQKGTAEKKADGDVVSALGSEASSVAAEPLIDRRKNAFASELANQSSFCLHLQLDTQIFGGDAPQGNTRTHPEHDG